MPAGPQGPPHISMLTQSWAVPLPQRGKNKNTVKISLTVPGPVLRSRIAMQQRCSTGVAERGPEVT